MQNFKEKLYNYEAEPPAEIWQNINAELDGSDTKIVSMTGLRKRSKLLFYGITAAASLVIIFLISIFFNTTQKNVNTVSNSANQTKNLLSKQIQDSLNLNDKILKEIINSSKDKNLTALNYENSSAKEKKYLTIAGPDCQPVKISPKVATLIESADNEYPPKPVWNKKIEQWKQIMLNSTLSTTSTNLLDIVQLYSTDNNNE
jgi:sensor c-di-GMP phosphodiesterase-like protein